MTSAPDSLSGPSSHRTSNVALPQRERRKLDGDELGQLLGGAPAPLRQVFGRPADGGARAFDLFLDRRDAFVGVLQQSRAAPRIGPRDDHVLHRRAVPPLQARDQRLALTQLFELRGIGVQRVVPCTDLTYELGRLRSKVAETRHERRDVRIDRRPRTRCLRCASASPPGRAVAAREGQHLARRRSPAARRARAARAPSRRDRPRPARSRRARSPRPDASAARSPARASPHRSGGAHRVPARGRGTRRAPSGRPLSAASLSASASTAASWVAGRASAKPAPCPCTSTSDFPDLGSVDTGASCPPIQARDRPSADRRLTSTRPHPRPRRAPPTSARTPGRRRDHGLDDRLGRTLHAPAAQLPRAPVSSASDVTSSVFPTPVSPVTTFRPAESSTPASRDHAQVTQVQLEEHGWMVGPSCRPCRRHSGSRGSTAGGGRAHTGRQRPPRSRSGHGDHRTAADGPRTHDHPAPPARPAEHSGYRLLGLAWLVLFPVALSLEPAAAQTTSIPLWGWVVEPRAASPVSELTAAGLAFRRTWGGAASLVHEHGLRGQVFACPATGHHALGLWWFGEFGVRADAGRAQRGRRVRRAGETRRRLTLRHAEPAGQPVKKESGASRTSFTVDGRPTSAARRLRRSPSPRPSATTIPRPPNRTATSTS